ncbi:MAG: chemotaxis protein CheW [Planctomycetes bacterium]|nr:chemotaxis protein CheW [Planctomycetota bacterium]
MKNAARTTDSWKNMEFCSFQMAEQLYGVNIIDIKEITSVTRFTLIHHAPSHIKGYLNIRGLVHLVLDFRQMIGLEPAEITEDSRVILLMPQVGPSFGILVDRIGNVVTVNEDQISERRGSRPQAESSDTERRTHSFSMGVYMLKEELLVLINARQLLRKTSNDTTR